jgi:hypothetical protein
MKNKKTIYIEDIFKKAENRLKNIVYSKNFKKWFFYSFFIALIIIIVIFYNAFKSSEEAEATWWDDTWSYRRAITVTNNNSEQSEVYINLTIDSSDTTKFQADCGDLRFTDINGNIIPYYIVSGCGTVTTSINVYYDTLKAGASTLYYYYGNSSAEDGFSSTNFSIEASNYSVGTPSSEEKSKAPVGYWSFDEGYGITAYDGSGKGNDGTITGATWASEDQCVVGKCLSFDGVDDYVQTQSNNSLNFGGDDFSAFTWVKFNKDASNQYFLNGMGGVGGRWHVYISSSNKMNVFLEDIEGNYSSIGSLDYDINKWYYFGFVRDETIGKVLVYRDGKLLASVNDSTGTMGTDTIGIGTYGTHWFKGYLDEPKIYPYARTADEIKQDYNAGLVGMGTSKGAGVAIGGSSDKWMTDGLVGHWKMDEASWNGTAGEVIDSSGNGNNGTSAGGATTGAGKFGSGGSFDGVDDYVNAGDDSSLNPGHITVSAWIKKPSGTTGTVLRKGSSYLLDFWSIGNSLRFTINSKWSLGAGVVYPDDGNWHFLLGTYDGQNINVFIDGELKKTDAHVDSIFVTSNSLSIGKNSVASDNYFNGQIDEARIYNRALSADEVKKLYEYAPGPVGHWKMDEKSGTTAYDISGNGNHGTLTNGPTWTEGKYGGAVEFDGVDDYVNGNLESSYSDYTVGGWVNRNGIQSANYPVFVAFGTYSPGFYLEFNDNDYVSYYRNGISVQTFFPLSDITINNWHYIVFKKEDSTISAYLDGKFKNSITDTDSLDNSFILNGDKAGVTPNITTHWGGKMDDFKIYNYARTQKQILEDMNAGRPAQNKPVAYWKFNEGYGTTAYDSAGNNNGTINGAIWTNEGKFGKGLSFDGVDDYTQVSYSSELNLTEAVSVSAWFKADDFSTTGGVAIGYLVGKAHNYILGFDTSSHATFLAYPSSGSPLYIEAKTGVLSAETWYHVIGVFDGVNNKIYLNGELKDSVNIGEKLDSSTDNILIGGLPNDTRNFDGQMDEIKVYNYALSEDEIKKDYNQGKTLVMGSPKTASGATGQSAEYCVPGDTATCDPPVAEWKFDDKSGTTVYDTSSNANHGTMSNMEDSDWKTSDQCKKGRCLEFDGVDDYLDAGSSPSLILANGGSIEAWVKIGKLETGWDNGIIHKGDGASWVNNHYGIIEMDGTNKFILTISDGTNYLGLSGPTTKDLEENVWYHVAGTWNNSSKCIYVNGVLQECVNSTIMPKDTMTSCSVSAGRYKGSYYFNGLIDDVKIYDYARTPAQVAWDYNRGKPIGHWKMDEGEGMTVYDHSGNGNHGTMVNMSQSAWVDGKVNGGLEFDGVDDYVLINHDGQLQFKLGDFSVFSWANKNILAGWTGIITTDTTGDAAWKIYKDNDNDYFTARFGSTVLNYPSYSVGEWNHYGYVKKGTTLEIYFNGEFFNSIECSATHNVTNNELVFGSYRVYDAERGAYIFNGEIDDVQIYNYALTAEQIKEVYNGGAVRFR